MVYDDGALEGLCKQDYKCLCAGVTISVTLVNIQTHTHRQELSNWAKNTEKKHNNLSLNIKPKALVHM